MSHKTTFKKLVESAKVAVNAVADYKKVSYIEAIEALEEIQSEAQCAIDGLYDDAKNG